MNDRVLALRNRAVRINNSSDNINQIHNLHNFNSTAISESNVNKAYCYKQRLQILKAEFFNQSIEIEKALNNTLTNMEYAFPTDRAMMCIPDFHGESKDLERFLYQIDFFAKRIPEEESEEELVATRVSSGAYT